MKGYLQRLAASVAEPRPSLHPLVGSIFPGTMRAAAAGDLHESDAVTSVAADGTGQAAQEQPRSAADPARRRVPEAEAPVGQPPAITPLALHEIFRPLMPRRPDAAEIPLAAREPADAAVPALPVPADPGDAVRPSSAGSRKDLVSTPIADALRLDPLVAADPPASSREREIAPTPARRPRETPGVAPGDAARRAVPPRPLPAVDDIQIHIGRVEVIALAPAAARPAAPPARKAMSLDEYLRRRDGRAG
jgi:hypothetical protein